MVCKYTAKMDGQVKCYKEDIETNGIIVMSIRMSQDACIDGPQMWMTLNNADMQITFLYVILL